MKKALFCGVVLFLILAASVFAERAQIEEAVSSYEAIAAEAEKLAEKPLVDINDFSVLDEKATAAEAKIKALENEREWMIQDAKRLAVLRARFNQAMATVVQKLFKY